MFISQNGMVQRTSVRGINRYGRTSQGVRVMNLRDGDEVSAVALVVESDAPTAAGDGPISLDASGDGDERALTGELSLDAALAEDEGVIAADPNDPSTLQPPEVVADDMPDSDLEA